LIREDNFLESWPAHEGDQGYVLATIAPGARLNYGLVWDVLTGTLAGLSVAFVVFWFLSYQAYSIRLIDLVSFLLGFLALIGGLFSSFHYQGDLLQSIDRLWVRSSVVDIAFDVTVDIMRLCTRIPHTPFRPPASRQPECDKLNQYLIGLKFDPDTILTLRLPNVADYHDPDVRKVADRVLERVNEANRQIETYNRDRSEQSKTTFIEALFRDLALPVLAFAFGLGGGRRVIDLYFALPSRLQEPIKTVLSCMRRLSRRSRRKIWRIVWLVQRHSR
jgi:hypothetical protein